MSDDKPAPSSADATAMVDQPATWDEDYDNPKNEIVLVSSDNVGFRVDAWTFGKKSQFIKDLLEVPSGQELDHAPIPLDCSANIARTFCDIIYTRAQAAVKTNCTVSGFEALFALADRFEAPVIAKAISEAFPLRVDAHAHQSDFDHWKIFTLAARRDDYDFARTTAVGLARTDRYLASNVLNPNPVTMQSIPSRYLRALIRSLMTNKSYEPGPTYNNLRPYDHWLCETDGATVFSRFKLD